MRGKANGIVMLLANTRITPAYAGKSDMKAYMEKMGVGSPPPMRGKVFPCHART